MNKNNQLKNNIYGLMFLSFVFAIIYIVGHTRTIIDIISSYVKLEEKTYINLSNIAYCLTGIAYLIMPILIIYPYKLEFNKPVAIKVACYSLSVLYLIGDLWIITWLFNCIGSRNLSFDVAQLQKTHNYMFNHLQWASRNAETIFYNFATSALWFLTGYNINRDRRKTCRYYILLFLLSYLLPMVYFFLYRGKNIPDWWLKKSIPLIISNAIMMCTFIYAVKNRETWKNYICILDKEEKKEHHHSHIHHHSHSDINNNQHTQDSTDEGHHHSHTHRHSDSGIKNNQHTQASTK